MKYILIILVIVIILIFLFIKLYKPFGKRPTKKDYQNYQERSSNFHNGKFTGNSKFKRKTDFYDQYISRSTNKSTIPNDELPYVMYKYNKPSNEDILVHF